MTKETEIIIDSEYQLAVLSHHAVAVSFPDQKKKPIETLEKNVFPSNDWVFWGDGDSYPKDVLDRCNVNTIIPSTILWKANQISSGDLRPGYMKVDETTSEEKFVPVYDNSEINDFIERNNLLLYCMESLRDLYWWNMAMADIGLDATRNKIVSIVAQEMSECRIGRQNEKTGLRDFIFMNANWPSRDVNFISKQRAIDPYYDVVGQIRNGSDYRYMYPLNLSVPGKKTYQNAPWHSIIDSKWLDVSEKIPKLKSKLMDNQMHIKYVIYVPTSWWKDKYKGWDSFDQKTREEKRLDELTKFNNILTGIDNVGKTVMLNFNDSIQGREYAKWEIKQLSEKIETNMYIEDSQEASSHILYALNVDGSLIGNSPGKQMGAGSGSDKRSAFNIFILSNRIYQRFILEPLNKIAAYNGWKFQSQPIIWQLKNEMMSTQDAQKPEKRI